MSSVFTKLNLKHQTKILVFNAPSKFETELAKLEQVSIARDVKGMAEISFALAFVTQQKEVDRAAKALVKKAKGDAVVWFAYPKGTSKNYTCEFNRDTGWAILGELGFEVVRQVAIDEDWSALRFRRVEFIKTMKRAKSRAITKQGQARVKG
jgi:riboflavin synthase